METQNGEWWMVLLAFRPYGGGTTIGLYASGNGRKSRNGADFDLFEYRADF